MAAEARGVVALLLLLFFLAKPVAPLNKIEVYNAVNVSVRQLASDTARKRSGQRVGVARATARRRSSIKSFVSPNAVK